ncbi:MAG: 16S rRNA (cytidine(1402)-2'-O)-methyltransferase [Planctomycetia bacterium]|nr:16S rRNA (cytidine(1402)-2'-O)-methyltransferase [Planctomycetia bacterium]
MRRTSVFIQKSYRTEDTGELYLVPTPIGNLSDMTFRAIDVLRDADLILTEDTRHTRKLLTHFEIDTPMQSFHKFNTAQRIPEVIERLKRGKVLAEVSDAGMPIISDPGQALVEACVKEHLPVIPLPGANAGLTGLVASGLPGERFTFIGFPPRQKKALLGVLTQYKDAEETLIFYESPYRLKETLKQCAFVFGEERQAVVARELTKQYETFYRGDLAELIAYSYQVKEIKGEICLLIAGTTQHEVDDALAAQRDLPYEEQVDWVMANENLSAKEAIKRVAKRNDVPKQTVYAAYHHIN